VADDGDQMLLAQHISRVVPACCGSFGCQTEIPEVPAHMPSEFELALLRIADALPRKPAVADYHVRLTESQRPKAVSPLVIISPLPLDPSYDVVSGESSRVILHRLGITEHLVEGVNIR
jgi:hypothetical protein